MSNDPYRKAANTLVILAIILGASIVAAVLLGVYALADLVF